MNDEISYVCPECGAEIEKGVEECEECGTALEWAPRVEKRLSEARELISKVEKLIYWAEKFDVDTVEVQEILSESKKELEVGDWERSKEYAQAAYDDLHVSMIDGLKEELKRERQELKAMSKKGEDISDVKNVLKKAISSMKDGELDDCIGWIKEYREMTDRSV